MKSRTYLGGFAAVAWGTTLILLSCSGDARNAGESCEDDDECPGNLECIVKECDSGVISYCSIECEISEDCTGFLEPSCTRISGLRKTCIEEGQNPCER
jgi:hypothetical protein